MSASTTFDELDALDNATLRAKCLEFGLPNVPITSTSRKVLIKKLSLAMNADDTDKSSTKNRRETIHVTKIPTLVESNQVSATGKDDATTKQPPNRASNRRTMAVPPSISDNSISENSEFVKTTRTKAATPDIKPISVAAPLTARRQSISAEKVAPIRAHAEKRKTIVIEEDDDEDLIIVEAVETTEKTNRIKAIPRSRESRSVSLSNTGVVTTSYNQEVVSSPPPTIEETESDNESFVGSYAKSFDNPRSDYGPRDTVLPSLGRGYSQRPFDTSDIGYSSASTMRSSTNRISAEPELYKSFLKSRYTTMSSNAPSQTSSQSTSSRRYTTNTNPISTYNALYNENSDGQDEDDIIKPTNTPYLSSFARSLERLKEVPLKGAQTPGKQDLQMRYNSSKVMGRYATDSKESIADSFWDLFHALNRKYDLKSKLSIFAVIVVVAFIYFVFIR